ncbi:MAG: hypothetical protein JSU63_02585 [Phycisphaerales bacterium]|nr:MAG: hypothetical protein JSU63_02585 [Phycisphaerales bacterium]
MIARTNSPGICPLWLTSLCAVLAMLSVVLSPVDAFAATSSGGSYAQVDDGKGPPPEEARDKDKARKARSGARRTQPPKVDIDPELQKQIDELIEADPQERLEKAQQIAEERKPPDKPKRDAARRGRGRVGAKTRRPRRDSEQEKPVDSEAEDAEEPDDSEERDDVGERRGSARAKRAEDKAPEEPKGPATTLNIEPAEDAVPPEERMYRFSIKGGTYEQLMEGVARQTGLGVIGEAPKGGSVDFVTDEELTFEEFLSRVRLLLFKYKPHEPYWLMRKETHLEVIRVTDIYRILEPKQMFASVEMFRAADFKDHELALVKYTPEFGSVADLQAVRDFMPDYVRVTPLEDQNAVMIFALVSDIEKYLEVAKFVRGEVKDPRTLEVIAVEHVLPSDAVAKLSDLMELDGGGGAAPRKSTKSKRRSTRDSGGSALANIREPETSVVPIDAQSVILVRAMKDKIEEIKYLLPFVDVDTEESHDPVVIAVKHAEPEQLVSDIQQILVASSSSDAQATPKKKPSRRTSKKKGRGGSTPSAGPISADEITMLAHPTQSAIIVIADEDGVERVREYVEMFDVKTIVERVPIELEYIDADEVIPALEALLGPVDESKSDAPQLVADLSGGAIWFTGREEDLVTVREMVKLMDNADDVVSLHIVRLVNQRPSFVAEILNDIAKQGGGSTKPKARSQSKRRGKKGGKSPSRPASSSRGAGITITPNDQQGRLYILCTDAEFEEYSEIIAQLESQPAGQDFVLICAEHIGSEEAISKISELVSLDPSGKKGSELKFESTDDGCFLVMGANEAEIKTIKDLLAQFDLPRETERRTFVIKYGDPAEIAGVVRTLVSGEGTGGTSGGAAQPKRRPRRGGRKAKGAGGGGAQALTGATASSDDLSIVQLGNRLIVEAPPDVMKEVAALIEEFDVEERTTEIRIYEDFPPGTNIEEIAATLASRFGKAGGGAKKGQAQATTEADFIPQVEVGKLVVIAEPPMFPEIEELLEILRVSADVAPIEIVLIDVEHADPAELVATIEPLLALKVQELIDTGRLIPTAHLPALPAAPVPAAGTEKRGRRPAAKPKRATPSRSGRDESLYHLDADIPNGRIIVAAAQVVIDEARKLIVQFDLPSEAEEIVVEVVAVEYADPTDLVATVQPLLALQVQQMLDTGELEEAGGAPGGAKTAGKRAARKRTPSPQAGLESYHIAPDAQNQNIVVAGPQAFVDEAKKLITQFDQAGADDDPVEMAFIAVQYADPEEVIQAVDPLLALKVQQMIGSGEVSDVGDAGAAPRAKKRKGGPTTTSVRRASQSKQYHLVADTRNQRVVIAATQTIIDEATKLIVEFDQPVEDATQFTTVQLENSSPEDMVKAVNALMGKGSSGPRRKGRGKPGQQPPPATVAGEFKIVEAPGGGAVVLSGPKEDVDQAKDWIAQLDTAGQGKEVKIYEIPEADMSRLVDLVMAHIDTAPVQQKKARGGRQTRRPATEPEPEEDEFEILKTRVGTDVYVQANLIDNTMLVSASRSKIVLVDALVAQLYPPEGEDTGEPSLGKQDTDIPKLVYELQWADDAFDAAFDLESVLDVLFETDGGAKPVVDYASFGNLLIVKYPDEDRFPEIEELITKFVDKAPEIVAKRKTFAPPAGVSLEQMLIWMQMNQSDIDFEVIDITPEEVDYNIEELQPMRTEIEGGSRCILPTAFQRMSQAVLAGAMGQVEPPGQAERQEPIADSEDDQPDNVQLGEDDAEGDPHEEGDATSDDDEEDLGFTSDEMIRDLGRSMGQKTTSSTPDELPAAPVRRRTTSDKKEGKDQRVRLMVDREKGVVHIEGAPAVLQDVPEWMTKLKEDTDKLPTPPPDIRIVRVKYIDVFAARDIIDEMFNATQQQRQMAQQQQRQQQRLLQQQQRRQQQQAARAGQQGQPGQPGRPGQRGQQPRQQMIQLPPTTVRVTPNPRDRTLILRAEPNQYPALYKLLATIDQPQPISAKHRVYPLKKLNAVEVEELLTDWLGLNEVSSRQRSTPAPRQRGQRGRGARTPTPTASREAAGHLPEPIMATTFTGSELGVDPKDIKLSSNETANTILAMAPVQALDYIGELIDALEAQDVAEREWKDYELKYANVEHVAEYLRSRYGEPSESSSGSGARGRRQRSERGSAPSSTPAIHTPTFVAYPRLKMLSVQATPEKIVEVDEIIELLDIDTGDDQYKSVHLDYADAAVVADNLTAMFGVEQKSRGGGRGRGSQPQATVDFGPKFIGEEGGTIVYYRAPTFLHERILTVVEDLEGQYKWRSKVRVIRLQHAKASEVAEALEGAYGGGTSAKRTTGRSGKRGSKDKSSGRKSSGGTSRLSITADDATKQLFVMADDDLFTEIESLVKLLDEPRKLDFAFKIYPLQYADAESIYATMDKMVADYIKRLGRDADIEAFSVDVDENANALIVLGGPVVFGFVEDALMTIDIPENAASPPTTLVIKPPNADAAELAQNINTLWGEQRSGRRSSKQGGPTKQDAPVAEANKALNLLIVRGTKAQVDEIKETFIDPLEEHADKALITETLALTHVRVEHVAEPITKFFEDRQEAMKERGRDGRQLPANEMTVVITPDVHTNQLIVEASEENLKLIKERLAKIDTEEVASTTKPITRVYPCGNADPTAVVNIIKERFQQQQQQSQRGSRGRGGSSGTGASARDMVTAVAEPMTQTVVVTASAANHETIKTMLEDLNNDEIIEKQQAHVVRMDNASADAVATTLNEIFVKNLPRGGRGGGQVVPISISALQGSNSLLIKCSDKDYAEIAEVIEQLDSEEAISGEEVRVVTLLYGDATEMQEALQEYLRKPGTQVSRGSADLVGDVRLSVLETGNSLVISGDKDRVDEIEAVVRELDKAGEKGSVPQIIPLDHTNVGVVLASLQEMFTEKTRGGKRGETPPVIVGNDNLNVLIVRARPSDLVAIEAVVKRLDTPEAADKPNFRLIKVSAGLNVEDVAEMVEVSVNEGARSQFSGTGRDREIPSITVTPYKSIGAVVVSGPANLFDEAEKLIRKMEEQSGSTGRTTTMITLTNTDAADVQRLIDVLKGESSGASKSKRSSGSSRGSSSRRSSPSRSPSRPRSRR